MPYAKERFNAEYHRIFSGPEPNESPGGQGTVRFVVRCPFGADQVLQRVRDVMRAVHQGHSSGLGNVAAWRDILPEWFLAASPPSPTDQELESYLAAWRAMPPDQQSAEEARRAWPLEDWLYWMDLENRKWFWWDAKALSEIDHIVFAVEVLEWPFAWGAVRWLFRACGASLVEPES